MTGVSGAAVRVDRNTFRATWTTPIARSARCIGIVAMAGSLAGTGSRAGAEIGGGPGPRAMLPIVEAFRAGQPKEFPAIRCAGLFLSMLEIAGPDALEAAQTNEVKSIAFGFVETAVRTRFDKAARDGGAPVRPEVAETVYAEVAAATVRYLGRSEARRGRPDRAWDDDPLVRADLGLCGTLAEPFKVVSPD